MCKVSLSLVGAVVGLSGYKNVRHTWFVPPVEVRCRLAWTDVASVRRIKHDTLALNIVLSSVNSQLVLNNTSSKILKCL